ncbi:MAG: hypothetical protein LBS86_00790 [Treponema sp.]|jgi:prophage antirepressor-like protein|nr:hypothetical protein [Treponema sp.]
MNEVTNEEIATWGVKPQVIHGLECISELDAYRLMLHSLTPEAIAFQAWTSNIMKELRRIAGLEGFDMIKMLNKKTQKKILAILKNSEAKS